MTIEDSFIHTGINHQIVRPALSNGDGNASKDFKIVLSQTEYAAALRPVEHHSLANMKETDVLEGLLYSCFLTLLGALAWLLQTRLDVAVYVAYLQRYCKAPTAKHLRQMNRLLGYVHRKIKGLTYETLQTPLSLVLVGDSGLV